MHLLDTYRHINQVYYKERQARKQEWDDKYDNYIIKAGENFNNRFQLKKQIGKGSFGVVAYAYDNQVCGVPIFSIFLSAFSLGRFALVWVSLIQRGVKVS